MLAGVGYVRLCPGCCQQARMQAAEAEHVSGAEVECQSKQQILYLCVDQSFDMHGHMAPPPPLSWLARCCGCLVCAGLAIRDFWGVDDTSIVFVADPTFGDILNFNVGQAVDLEVPQVGASTAARVPCGVAELARCKVWKPIMPGSGPEVASGVYCDVRCVLVGYCLVGYCIDSELSGTCLRSRLCVRQRCWRCFRLGR
eukprot:GHRQ01024456.1.p1 GENE.GHRQ01024456.1~~GHRQ01024456.1.p1  ORF type:complete len:199 (-),score=26.75 GHRQ01024456.1:397-993(-)